MVHSTFSLAKVRYAPNPYRGDWDSMERVITQTHDRVFQFLNRVLKIATECLKGSVARFERNIRPSLLIKGYIHHPEFLKI